MSITPSSPMTAMAGTTVHVGTSSYDMGLLSKLTGGSAPATTRVSHPPRAVVMDITSVDGTASIDPTRSLVPLLSPRSGGRGETCKPECHGPECVVSAVPSVHPSPITGPMPSHAT